jgi:hypothetical protein
MSAGHRINQVAVRVWAKHLLHAVAGAKSQITCRVKFSVPTAQDSLRRVVTVVTLRHGEPIEKESCQGQAVPSGCFSGDVTQATLSECEYYLWLEFFDRFLQRAINRQGPY